MRIPFLCALISTLALAIGCLPPTESKQSDTSAVVKQKVKKNKSTICPELQKKAIARIKELQGTFVEKDGAIVEVDLMNKPVIESDVELVSQLSDVTKLSLSSPAVTDVVFAKLANLPKLVNLQMLNTGITDEGLKAVPQFPALKALGMRGCAQITNQGMTYVAQAPKLDNLALLYTLITDDGVIALENMKLRALDLRGLMLSGSSCNALAKITTLESLKLRNARDIMDDSFLELKSLTNLTNLSLEDLAIGDEALNALEGMPNLKELVIMRTDLMDISALKCLKNLKKLTLREMNADLDVLAELPQLEQLFLGESLVRDKDMNFFENLKEVNTLDLWNTQLGDQALELFASFPKLKVLNIKNCGKITDAGINLLAKSGSLESLDLSENGKALDDNGKPMFTDKSLESLQNCKTLKSLNINLCPSLTQEAIDAFAKARPDVKLTR